MANEKWCIVVIFLADAIIRNICRITCSGAIQPDHTNAICQRPCDFVGFSWAFTTARYPQPDYVEPRYCQQFLISIHWIGGWQISGRASANWFWYFPCRREWIVADGMAKAVVEDFGADFTGYTVGLHTGALAGTDNENASRMILCR